MRGNRSEEIEGQIKGIVVSGFVGRSMRREHLKRGMLVISIPKNTVVASGGLKGDVFGRLRAEVGNHRDEGHAEISLL